MNPQIMVIYIKRTFVFFQIKQLKEYKIIRIGILFKKNSF